MHDLRTALRLEALRQFIADDEGGSAVEFALVFPVFFLFLYGSISYGLIFALTQTMTFAAEQGTRATLAADPTTDNYELIVVSAARTSVAESLAWLSPKARAVILGSDNGAVDVSIVAHPVLGSVVEVVVEYPNYAADPLIPVISFPGLGSIPPLPASLRSRAVARL